MVANHARPSREKRQLSFLFAKGPFVIIDQNGTRHIADGVKLQEGKAKEELDALAKGAAEVKPLPGVNVQQLRNAIDFFQRTGRTHNPPSEKPFKTP
jgi:hypothetical protein